MRERESNVITLWRERSARNCFRKSVHVLKITNKKPIIKDDVVVISNTPN